MGSPGKQSLSGLSRADTYEPHWTQESVDEELRSD